MKYIVYWIGGKRDGEVLAEFFTEAEAVNYAKTFYNDYIDQFQPGIGGVGVLDENFNLIL